MDAEEKKKNENNFCLLLYLLKKEEMAEWFKAADCKSVEFFSS